MKNKQKSILKVFIILFLIFIIFLSYKFDLFKNLSILNLSETIKSFGILAPIIYILLMITAIVISPIPSLPLDISAGIVFGTYLGTLYSVIGAEIGAIIAFLISRTFAREYLSKKFKKEIKMLDGFTENKLVFFIFISRLFPIFQFDIISYAAGITKIKLYKFAIATFFGMIPMTFIFVYTGSSVIVNPIISIILITIITILIFIMPKVLEKYKILK